MFLSGCQTRLCVVSLKKLHVWLKTQAWHGISLRNCVKNICCPHRQNVTRWKVCNGTKFWHRAGSFEQREHEVQWRFAVVRIRCSWKCHKTAFLLERENPADREHSFHGEAERANSLPLLSNWAQTKTLMTHPTSAGGLKRSWYLVRN